MIWQKALFKRRKDKWFMLGIPVLLLALAFIACLDKGYIEVTSHTPIIRTTNGCMPQVNLTGFPRIRASFRSDGMACELPSNANIITVSRGMIYAENNYSEVKAREACNLTDRSKRGPPMNEGERV